MATRQHSCDLGVLSYYAHFAMSPVELTMEVRQAYQFDCDQTANRFLNDVRSGTIAGVSAKFYRNNATVLVFYAMNDVSADFDSRSSDLDDLARQYDGAEVNL